MISRFSTNALKTLEPYKAASQDIWQKESKTILKLDWNEGVIDPPEIVNSAFKEFFKNKMVKYYPNTFNDELLESIAKFVSSKKSNISYFSGIDHLHEYIVRAFLEEGDKVSILHPTYDNFRAVCESASVQVEKINFYPKPDIEITQNFKSKIVYFANPNNPTGDLIESEFIEKWLQKNPDTLFIVDEAYIDFSGGTSARLVSEYENILICRTLSKAFCLAGIRFGYCIACDDIINSINLIRNPKSVSMFAQIMANAALQNSQYVQDYVVENNKAKELFRQKILEKFPAVKLHGNHGNFQLVEFSNKQDSCDFIEYLKKEGVFIRNTHHLIPNSCRITIPIDQGLELILKLINEF